MWQNRSMSVPVTCTDRLIHTPLPFYTSAIWPGFGATASFSVNMKRPSHLSFSDHVTLHGGCDPSRFCTLGACLGLRKNEVLAVKKVKSSLSSSRLQYPLLMLLLLVMDGVTTVLTVMEKS